MRALATTALAFSAAVFAACYLLEIGWLLFPAACMAVVGAILLVLRRRWLRGFGLALLGCAAGLGWFWLHAQFTTVEAARYDGETRAVHAKIVSFPLVAENYTRVEVKLDSDGLPRVKALLYDNDGVLNDAEPGEWLDLEARLRPADRRYGESYDGYISRDIYLIASAKGEIRRTPGGLSPELFPLRLNRMLTEHVQGLFPEDTAAFFRALMLGDKSGLYQDKGLHTAMSRAGLMHAVAVSGMHIVFLIGLIQTVLGRNRLSSLLGIALVWLFVLVTGASPSAVRAGLMQTLLLLAPLLRRENDVVTSLSAALGMILLLNPFAATSVGLQLSFASLAGILCFSERLSEGVYAVIPGLRRSSLGRGAVGALVNSLAVMPFTLPLMAVHFGYICLLSPLTNVLAFWAISGCFCLAYVVCAVGLASFPVGVLLAKGLSYLARYLFSVAWFVSSLPGAAVYLERVEIVAWLVLVYVLFIAARFLRLPARLRTVAPAALAVVLLAGLRLGARLDYESGPGTIAALDVGQGQCLCVLSGRQTMLIDCGGLGTLDNAGDTAASYLDSRGRRQVDVLLLTHLDADHCNGVTTLMELCPIRRILLSEDPETDNGMLEEIVQAAETHGTELVTVRQDSALTLGGLSAEIYAPDAETKGNDHGLCCVVSLGDYDMLVTGDLSIDAEEKLLERYPLHGLELLIAGHHGSKYAGSERLLGSIGAREAVISCGYNTYGHPAPETLERLAAAGYTVRRTDEEGTIEIRMENAYGEKE